MGNALKMEICHLNQSEIEISEMMKTRQDDLDRLSAYKEELKHTIDEMQKDTREIRKALEGKNRQEHTGHPRMFDLVLKMTAMPKSGNYDKTNEKLTEYAKNMEKYFGLVREEQKEKRKRCVLM